MNNSGLRVDMERLIFAFCLCIVTFSNAQSISLQSEQKIKEFISSYYEVISGPIGEKRDLEKLKSLYHPEALLTYSYWNEGNLEVMTMTVDDYISKLDYMDKVGFNETEISHRINYFSSIAQVYSVFKFFSEDGTINGRGITSYDLIYDGKKYLIVSMNWVMENEDFKIPDQYLKQD